VSDIYGLDAYFPKEIAGRVNDFCVIKARMPLLKAAGRRGAIPQEARSRCRTCASEDLCERWLAGGVEGDNRFCENARMFRGSAGTGARSAA